MDKINNFLSFLPQTQYCERAGSSAYNAEPVNAITNIAFFIAAYYLYKLLKTKNLTTKSWLVFPVVLAFIGLGSTLFHVFSTPITLVLDFTPLYLFYLLFLYKFFKTLNLSLTQIILIMIGFAATIISLTIFIPPDFLNGSIRHVVLASILLLFIFISVKHFKHESKTLIHVFIFYAFGIFFRTIEPIICPQFPLGTHFSWHLIMALAAFYAVKFLTQINKVNK